MNKSILVLFIIILACWFLFRMKIVKKIIQRANEDTLRCLDCNEFLGIDDGKIRPCLHCMDNSWKEGYGKGISEGFNKGKISHIVTKIEKTT